ncbi:MAG: hypothetical protein ACXWJ7_12845 [Caldimonas sp.]
MSIGFRRSATQDLSRVGLTVAPEPRRGRWLFAVLLALAMLAAGVAIGVVVRDRAVVAVVAPPAGAASEVQALRQELEQARLALRLSEARSHELERQIDALNQRLTASQDELTFFRKAREGKH